MARPIASENFAHHSLRPNGQMEAISGSDSPISDLHEIWPKSDFGRVGSVREAVVVSPWAGVLGTVYPPDHACFSAEMSETQVGLVYFRQSPHSSEFKVVWAKLNVDFRIRTVPECVILAGPGMDGSIVASIYHGGVAGSIRKDEVLMVVHSEPPGSNFNEAFAAGHAESICV